MLRLKIIDQTTIAKWYALVDDATRECGYHFNDSVQHYLIITLDHFTTDEELASVVIAFDFLHALESAQFKSNRLLRQVGDRCLLLAGLFPEYAAKRLVENKYFITLGQQAYEQLAQSPLTMAYNNELFHELSQEFIHLIDVLQAMRHLHHPSQH